MGEGTKGEGTREGVGQKEGEDKERNSEYKGHDNAALLCVFV